MRELLARNDSVIVVDRCASQSKCDTLFGKDAAEARVADIASRDSLNAAFQRADEVYHFAGRLGTSELDDDMRAAIDANITGAVNVLDAALAAGVSRVFYPSKPNVWLNTYTITKVAAEQFVELYRARGLQTTTLRYFNAYGPGQATGPVRKIIPTFALQALRGEPLSIYGDGEQTVDMIHASDIARITVDLTRCGRLETPADVGRGIPLPVNQVAADVLAHFGGGAGVAHLPMRVGEIPRTTLVADIAPIQQLLGDIAFADWRASLAKTLDWYAERRA